MTWLDKQIATIFIWYRRRRMMRSIPGYAATFTMEAESKRRHVSTAAIVAQRKRILLDALAGKVRT
jgi:hypothetical protein